MISNKPKLVKSTFAAVLTLNWLKLLNKNSMRDGAPPQNRSLLFFNLLIYGFTTIVFCLSVTGYLIQCLVTQSGVYCDTHFPSVAKLSCNHRTNICCGHLSQIKKNSETGIFDKVIDVALFCVTVCSV